MNSGSCPAGTECTLDTDCASQVCLGDGYGGRPRICGQACTSDADCTGGFRCSQVDPNPNVCLPPCSGLSGSYVGALCLDGVESSCQFAPAGFVCGDCCSPWSNDGHCNCGAGEFCDLSGTNLCTPKGGLGAECTAHDQCQSGNCSRIFFTSDAGQAAPGSCQPAVGSACTDADCRVCANPGTAESYCHLTCDTFTTCPANSKCIGRTAADGHWDGACVPNCTGLFNCPSGYSCTYTSDNSTTYCRVL